MPSRVDGRVLNQGLVNDALHDGQTNVDIASDRNPS